MKKLDRVWKLAEETFEEEKLINDGGLKKICGTTRAPCPRCYSLFLKIRYVHLKSCVLMRVYCAECKFNRRKFVGYNRLKPCCLKRVDGRLKRVYGKCDECEDFLC